MATERNIVAGSKVWIEDRELAWVDGEVIEVVNGQAKVLSRRGKMLLIPIQKVHPRDPDIQPGGVDDMTKLAYLNEPGVLYNLGRRYELNDIYTYTGNILIAVNPFTKLPHLYDAHMMEQYREAPLGELSPHVFAIADASYRAMINEQCSQSILVSGESGAGKTETTKLIMQYLAYIGGRSATDHKTVEQQVLESNPLLEAFGNAKTIRNDNSSRFGKFVEIQFDRNGKISGAAIRTYLLERSRVVQITDPERNYHCFYQLCASPEDTAMYNLGNPCMFHYLNQSNTYDLDGMSNAQEYMRTRRAMDIVGINLEEQEAIFRILAAILHLGNIEFAPGKDHDSSILKDQKSVYHLQNAAKLFMCDAKELQDALCTRIIVTREGNITKSLDPSAAAINRDALAKTLYSRLFDWLVDKINKSIGQDRDSVSQIGVLDIYGFESFRKNSFEQFCINLANEKLQQHFNQHVFKMEQEEYSKEEIDWSYIEFIDNQDVLDLIEKKPVGIISLLDEACMFPRSTHETFATKLFQSFRNHTRFSKPKLARTDFTIYHYAGEVTYQTDFFLDKNRDYIIVEHHSLLSSSKCSFIAGLFPPLPEDSSKSSYKFSSIATRFKQQLQALMDTLSLTEPHYIRCVKPNSDNRPGKFENLSVLHQLRCGGVLEAVRISCAGYPTRRAYDEFLDRFGLLAQKLLDGHCDEKLAAEKLLQKFNLSNYQLGKTKVFLRAGQMAELDARRAEVINNAAKIIQRALRTFIAWKEYNRKRKAALKIQTYWRGWLARKLYGVMQREAASIILQKYTRRWLLRKAYIELNSAVYIVQAGIRSYFACKEYHLRRLTLAVLNIQKNWRMCKARLCFLKLRVATVTFQCAWRSRLARRELRELKLAARETGALREAKNKLEKQCEDLAWRLQLEKRLRGDVEEAKNLEIRKLHNALEEMQIQLNTSKELAWREQEKNIVLHHHLKLASDQSSTLEMSYIEIKKLKTENEHIKISMEALEMKYAKTKKELEMSAEENEERIRRGEEAESRIARLEEMLHRLENKVSSLESENQVLRQQALAVPLSNVLGNHANPMTPQNTPEVHWLSNADRKSLFDSPIGSQIRRERNNVLSEPRQSRSINDKQQDNQEALTKCVKQDVGFSNNTPVAACIIYKCLLHWNAFEAERTRIFDHIIQTIGSIIEGKDDIDTFSYWLSNTSTLISLLQHNIKLNGVSTTPQRRYTGSSTLIERMTQGFKSPSNFGSLGIGVISAGPEVTKVEAKYPVILFKQQLTAYLEKIYGLIRDNVKKDISPLLNLCIQAPRTSRASMGKGLRSSNMVGIVQQTLSSHWQSIIKILNTLLNKLRENHVPPFLVRKLFTQVFSFIDVQLFNSLLLRRECCSFSNGEYIKSGLAELERWICEASEQYAGTSWDELRYIRQAVGFLPHLVLGLISQIIKIQLLADLNLKKTPELVELIDDSKDVEELMNLPPDKVLLKWMNFHLQKAGYKRKITNFSSDVKDGEAYAVLLNVLAPEYCSLTTLDTKDPMERANIILSQAEKMSCKRYLSPKDIVEGSPNLNLAFVAHLFHERNGLSVDSNKISFAEMMHDDVHVSREERAFRLWINSLGIDTYVNSGFEDVRNGWVLLEVLAKVVPGIVNWKQANRPPIKMPFKKVENCNQVIKIGKQLKFSLVNLAGNDIVQGNKKLILAFLWQLMRYSMLQLLKNLRLQSNGKEISDSDILNWANKKVTSTGRTSRMESFKDKTLANGIFFLELLSAVEPRVVNWYIVTKGEDDDEKRLNATYIISVARKLGCSIFLLPEDIVEVNPKMILTLTASIMLWSLTKQANEDTSTIVSDSENGSITGSISNIVIDDSASETSLPPDNESESASE